MLNKRGESIILPSGLPNDWCESESCSMDSLRPHGLHSPWKSPGQNTGVGSLSLFQGIFKARDWTQISSIAGRFFTSWATREAQNTGVGSLSLLQRIFPTQESNQGLLHCRWVLYQLSYQGSPEPKITPVSEVGSKILNLPVTDCKFYCLSSSQNYRADPKSQIPWFCHIASGTEPRFPGEVMESWEWVSMF